jgi:hypothetical protein
VFCNFCMLFMLRTWNMYYAVMYVVIKTVVSFNFHNKIANECSSFQYFLIVSCLSFFPVKFTQTVSRKLARILKMSKDSKHTNRNNILSISKIPRFGMRSHSWLCLNVHKQINLAPCISLFFSIGSTILIISHLIQW